MSLTLTPAVSVTPMSQKSIAVEVQVLKQSLLCTLTLNTSSSIRWSAPQTNLGLPHLHSLDGFVYKQAPVMTPGLQGSPVDGGLPRQFGPSLSPGTGAPQVNVPRQLHC